MILQYFFKIVIFLVINKVIRVFWLDILKSNLLNKLYVLQKS